MPIISSLLRPLPPKITCLTTTRLFSTPPTTISYFTDVEGDLTYLHRYLSLSSVLSPSPAYTTPTLESNSHVVFGGDVVDKGGSDLEVLKQILALKSAYPKNVHLITGNRDVNKMRLTSELPAETHGGVYWFRGRGLIGDPELGDVMGDRVERLKWILKSTMGCPDSFQLRKDELVRARGSDMVTDSDVVGSYLDSCKPEGLMGRYVMESDVAVKLGPCLFVAWLAWTPPCVLCSCGCAYLSPICPRQSSAVGALRPVRPSISSVHVFDCQGEHII